MVKAVVLPGQHHPHASQASFRIFDPNFLPLLSGYGFVSNVSLPRLSTHSGSDLEYPGPILDSIEFPSRFYAHTKGTQSLGHEGGIIAMLLVIWAASFGLDEQGLPFDNQDDICLPGRSLDNDTIDPLTPRENSQDAKLRERKDKIDAMLREVLELIDFHGVMRRPSFDGIQALLLALPLLEGNSLSFLIHPSHLMFSAQMLHP